MLSQDQHHRDEDCQRTKAAIKKLSFETFELNKQSIPGVSVISPAPSPVSQVWYTVNLLHGPEPGTGYYYTNTGSCPPHPGDGRVVITMVYWLLEDPAISQHLPQLSTELNLTLLHFNDIMRGMKFLIFLNVFQIFEHFQNWFWGDSRQDKAVLFISETSSALTNHLHWEL